MVAVQMYFVKTLLGLTVVAAIIQALCIETETVMVSPFYLYTVRLHLYCQGTACAKISPRKISWKKSHILY